MRKAGDIEWVSLAQAARIIGAEVAAEASDWADLEVGIRHVGVVQAQAHMRMLRRLRLDEMLRIKAEQTKLLEAGLTAEDVPEMFPAELAEGDVRTPEGEEQLAGVARTIVGGVLEGVRGIDVPEGVEPIDELARLGLLDIFLPAALEVQSPRPQFPPADASPSKRAKPRRVGRGR